MPRREATRLNAPSQAHANESTLSPGPDIYLKILDDIWFEDLTITWDESFQDVLAKINSERRLDERCTFEFTHRLPCGENQEDAATHTHTHVPEEEAEEMLRRRETTVRVEDDDLFDVMIEFALDQPGRCLEVKLVRTHWWPHVNKDYYVVRTEIDDNTCCAPIHKCSNWAWAGGFFFLF